MNISSASMSSLAAMQENALSPEQWIRGAFMIAKGVVSIWTAPVEFALRPRFGSRYFSPLTVILAWLLMQWALLLSYFLRFAGGAVPFLGVPHAPIDMGTLLLLFDAGCVMHFWRVWQLMKHPEREKDSEREGPPLMVFSLLPNGGRHKDETGQWADNCWPLVRVIYEPLSVILLAVLLWRIGVLQPIAALYLILAGLALALKTAIIAYEGWEYWRRVLDMRWRTFIIQAMTMGGKPQAMGAFVPAVMPKDMRPEELIVVAQRAIGLPADYRALVTPLNRNGDPEGPAVATVRPSTPHDVGDAAETLFDSDGTILPEGRKSEDA